MADDEDQVEGENGEAEAGGGKKKIVIIAVASLLLLGGGGGAAAYFMGLFGGEEPTTADAEQSEGDEDTADAGEDETDEEEDGKTEAAEGNADEESGEPAAIVFVNMPDVLVNLASSGKRMRFLKMKVALETANAEVATQVEALMPRIMDSFQIYLRALSIDEVRGSAGLAQLKDELLARVNHAIQPARVDDILVNEMLVQ